MTTNTPNTEETDGSTETELTHSIPLTAHIPAEIVERARERQQVGGGPIEDYLLDYVDVSVNLDNAPA